MTHPAVGWGRCLEGCRHRVELATTALRALPTAPGRRRDRHHPLRRPPRSRRPSRLRGGPGGQRAPRIHGRRPARRRRPESRDRVRAALVSSGLPWPRRRITVNLAPSGVRKGGAGLDLPIAVGRAGGLGGRSTPAAVAGIDFVGELGLDGSLRGVPAPWCWPTRWRPPRGPGRRRRCGGLAVHQHLRTAPDPGRGGRPLHGTPTVAAPVRTGGPDRVRPGGPTATSTWRTSVASGWPDGPSRWPPPAVTTCSWSGRRVRARRCSPTACPGCSRTSTRSRPVRWPGSTPVAGRRGRAAERRCGGHRSVRRTTACRRWP